jgi:GT2 family glycosyltransferase
MKVNVIFLDYDRHQFTEQVIARNFKNAGYPFDHVIIGMKGISRAINQGIRQSLDYDAVVTMANDILMPDGWLDAMVTAAKFIPNTGMCGIHCVEGDGKLTEINGIKVKTNFTAFGNVLIPMTAINAIGYFNEDYDPYGQNDADYAYRLNAKGFVNYYLDGKKSEHIGHDVGQPTDYRRMKDEGLNQSGAKWSYWTNYYDTTGDYTINFKEWPTNE